MNKKFLKFLCDPITKEDLKLVDPVITENGNIKEGKLCSKSNIYYITNFIPRFVLDQGYSDNFGYQWNKWAKVQFEDENLGRPMQGHTTNMFKSITGFSNEMLKGKVVLDQGCGPGRFTDVALKMGSSVIALDYSSAIDVARLNLIENDDHVLFVQADALLMPIKDCVIDYAFTIGVLHHTPNPFKGVLEAHRVLKENVGTYAIRVYPKRGPGVGLIALARGFYSYPMVRFWRSIFISLRPILSFYPPLVYSYLFGTVGYLLAKIYRPLSYPIRAVFPTAYLPDYRWTILDTFDAVATSYQSGHDPEDIEDWLNKANFSKVLQRKHNDFTATK
jgi:ubiquinone/menaquinone biosynthesis C-methylase UbiE